jgi:hypothetical protein
MILTKTQGIQQAEDRSRRRRRPEPPLIVAALIAVLSLALAGPALAAGPPTVTKVEPGKGPAAGGTSVMITGTNLTGATVRFGPNSAASFTVNSETSITAVSPALTSGTNAKVAVTVTTPEGTSPITVESKFVYEPVVTEVRPRSGSPAGGTNVTIVGKGFKASSVAPGEAEHGLWVQAVRFGATPTTVELPRESPFGEEMTAVAPAGTGTVDVTVNTQAGTSPITPADQFTYAEPPIVTKVEPTSGPTSGGTTVTITGSKLAGTTAVKFGPTNATSFTVNSETSITAVSPAGTGTVDVTVTTPNGTSGTSETDRFTYGPTVTKVEPKIGPAAGGTSDDHRHRLRRGHGGQVRLDQRCELHGELGNLDHGGLSRGRGDRRRDGGRSGGDEPDQLGGSVHVRAYGLAGGTQPRLSGRRHHGDHRWHRLHRSDRGQLRLDQRQELHRELGHDDNGRVPKGKRHGRRDGDHSGWHEPGQRGRSVHLFEEVAS